MIWRLCETGKVCVDALQDGGSFTRAETRAQPGGGGSIRFLIIASVLPSTERDNVLGDSTRAISGSDRNPMIHHQGMKETGRTTADSTATLEVVNGALPVIGIKLNQNGFLSGESSLGCKPALERVSLCPSLFCCAHPIGVSLAPFGNTLFCTFSAPRREHSGIPSVFVKMFRIGGKFFLATSAPPKALLGWLAILESFLFGPASYTGFSKTTWRTTFVVKLSDWLDFRAMAAPFVTIGHRRGRLSVFCAPPDRMALLADIFSPIIAEGISIEMIDGFGDPAIGALFGRWLYRSFARAAFFLIRLHTGLAVVKETILLFLVAMKKFICGWEFLAAS